MDRVIVNARKRPPGAAEQRADLDTERRPGRLRASAALSGALPAALSNSAQGGGVLCAKIFKAQLPASQSDVESANEQRAQVNCNESH